MLYVIYLPWHPILFSKSGGSKIEGFLPNCSNIIFFKIESSLLTSAIKILGNPLA